MPLLPLTIIGERINPGFASSRELLEREDLPGLQALAVKQVEAGARILNINVGPGCERDPAFMCRVIQAVQEAARVPLSFDSPKPDVQAACAAAWRPDRADGLPVLNSVTEHRLQMLDVARPGQSRLLFMASERCEGEAILPNTTPEATHETARRLVSLARSRGWSNDDCIIDVSVAPLASDTEGINRRALRSIARIGSDPDLAGVHMSVGISNLPIMLPKKARDGGPLGRRLETAFLTRASAVGLDMVLGTPWHRYETLIATDPVNLLFDRILAAEGFDALEILQEAYAA